MATILTAFEHALPYRPLPPGQRLWPALHLSSDAGGGRLTAARQAESGLKESGIAAGAAMDQSG
ncbi:hypothetical protein N8I74_14670 [Chitiniphilus purpureus]|uniref:Uncharacterized protein n=1 Tax=Chitiniphilus purpureus TaxID=2981137 RepID=A0ABY6DJY3_9NEIS|nr:hypothetical protein [Chitiniphilus sp. CD1]UXY14553.1 hypothetical protein N8I74_14670 [Chitiniphilus sp. CD1]